MAHIKPCGDDVIIRVLEKIRNKDGKCIATTLI